MTLKPEVNKPGAHPWHLGASFVISGLLAIFVFTVALFKASGNYASIAIVSGAIFFFSCSIVFGAIRRGGILSVVYGLYFVIFLSIPGILHIAQNRFPFFGLNYPAPDVLWTATLLLIFSIAALCGQIWASAKRSILIDKSPVSNQKLSILIILISVSAALAIATGPTLYIARRSDILDTTFSGGSELLLLLSQTARTCAIIALIGCCFKLKTERYTFGAVIFLMLAIILNSVVNFPLGIPRFSLFAYLLIFMHFFVDVTKSSFKGIFVLAMLIGTPTIFPFVSYLQRGDDRLGYTFDILEYFESNGDLDGFQSMINVEVYVESHGLTAGWQLLSAVFAILPRSAWPSKGWPTGSIAADNVGYDFINISSPLPAEFYIDFGVAGVILGGIIVGYWLERLDRVYLLNQNQYTLRQFLMIAGTSGFLIIILRGALLAVIAPVALYFLISLLSTMSIFMSGTKYPSQKRSKA